MCSIDSSSIAASSNRAAKLYFEKSAVSAKAVDPGTALGPPEIRKIATGRGKIRRFKSNKFEQMTISEINLPEIDANHHQHHFLSLVRTFDFDRKEH